MLVSFYTTSKHQCLAVWLSVCTILELWQQELSQGVLLLQYHERREIADRQEIDLAHALGLLTPAPCPPGVHLEQTVLHQT